MRCFYNKREFRLWTIISLFFCLYGTFTLENYGSIFCTNLTKITNYYIVLGLDDIFFCSLFISWICIVFPNSIFFHSYIHTFSPYFYLIFFKLLVVVRHVIKCNCYSLARCKPIYKPFHKPIRFIHFTIIQIKYYIWVGVVHLLPGSTLKNDIFCFSVAYNAY